MKNILICFLILIAQHSLAAPTKVGNGDDGTDLEGFSEIKSGKIYDARVKAVALVKRLNLNGINYLGALLPELENTKLFMTKRDISASKLKELGAFHSGAQKFVYARTFPKAYSSTRFFPVALNLDENQLIALHIHEALHRALPEEFREDEGVVSTITLAIVDPMTSHDHVRSIVKENIDEYTGQFKKRFRPYSAQTSLFYRSYTEKDLKGEFFSPITSSVHFQNRIYPFSGKLSRIGLGIDVTKVNTYAQSFLSNLGLYLSFDLFTVNGFDISTYGLWNRDMGNASLSSTSYLARDSFRGGIIFDKKSGAYSFKNHLEFLMKKEFNENYDDGYANHLFGSRTQIYSELQYKKTKRFSYGVFGELNLFGKSSHTINGTTFLNERSSLLTVGPVLSYTNSRSTWELRYRFVVENTRSSGDLKLHDFEGEGVGQDSISIGFHYRFY